MLFSITVSYVLPIEDVSKHLDEHKDWLVRYIKAGTILAAGPLQQGQGGFILAHAQDGSEIAAMIADDPFDRYGVAHFQIQAWDPVLCAVGFSQQWAPGARC